MENHKRSNSNDGTRGGGRTMGSNNPANDNNVGLFSSFLIGDIGFFFYIALPRAVG